MHCGSALADACLWGSSTHRGRTAPRPPLENAAQPGAVGEGGLHKNPILMLPTPSCRGAPRPISHMVCSSLWPLCDPRKGNSSPRCLLFDFAFSGVQTRGPDGTPMFNQTKNSKRCLGRRQHRGDPMGPGPPGSKAGQEHKSSLQLPPSDAHPEGFKGSSSRRSLGWGCRGQRWSLPACGDPPLIHMGALAGCDQEEIRCILGGFWFFWLPVHACSTSVVQPARDRFPYDCRQSTDRYRGLISGPCLQRTGCRKHWPTREACYFKTNVVAWPA